MVFWNWRVWASKQILEYLATITEIILNYHYLYKLVLDFEMSASKIELEKFLSHFIFGAVLL